MPTPANSINQSTTGISGFTGTGFTATPVTQYTVLVGGSTSSTVSGVGPGSSGQALQSAGSANPAYTTATYPDSTAQGDLLISSADNTITSLAKDTNATRYIANTGTSNNPAWAQIDATNGVTGTDVVANGGTSSTTLTANGVLIGNTTSALNAVTAGADGTILTGVTSADPVFATSSNGDFTFTSSTAGVTRNLTISNTDNTDSSSTALLTLSVGGTSAGNPFVRSVIGSARSYAYGINNNGGSQTFVINSAANATVGPNTGSNLFLMTTGGNFREPLNAVVQAYREAALTDVTGDGTVYTIIFDTETFDIGSNFDTTTGTFTAPLTGKYFVTANVGLTQIGAAHTSGELRIVSTARTWRNVYDPTAIAGAGGQVTLTISAVVSMTASDTLNIAVVVSGSTKTVDIIDQNLGDFTNVSINLIS